MIPRLPHSTPYNRHHRERALRITEALHEANGGELAALSNQLPPTAYVRALRGVAARVIDAWAGDTQRPNRWYVPTHNPLADRLYDLADAAIDAMQTHDDYRLREQDRPDLLWHLLEELRDLEHRALDCIDACQAATEPRYELCCPGVILLPGETCPRCQHSAPPPARAA